MINLDLQRTYPEDDFFQSPAAQADMLEVLFLWAKLHPEISYRQGMNELLAPIVWVCSQAAAQDPSTLYDEKFIRHDSFALFQALMGVMEQFYSLSDESKKTHELVGAVQPPLKLLGDRIQKKLLKQVDGKLATHLNQLGVDPPLYMM
jgi:TBC1 domain family protein 5